MARVLSISLPSLSCDSDTLTDHPFGITLPALRPVNQQAAPMFGSAILRRPVGLGVYNRVELLTQLHYDKMRFEQHHADPSLFNGEGDEDEESESEEVDDDGKREHRQTYGKKKKHINLTEEDLKVDWYEVLAVKQNDGASEAQIRAAYRQRCLETHPDKQPNHSDELFKKVQHAFDILGDPELRQMYDSSRPFDDSIPDEKVSEADFFTTFGPVFERNKKWSAESGLPSLGTAKTPYEEVVKFYNRWSGFRSWRDFSHLVELQEVSEDMCREEKRFYIRENERAVAHLKKEEMKRIKTLLERAQKNDPRVRRHLEAEAAKREKERNDREAFRQKMRDEAEQKRQAAIREEKEKAIAAQQEKDLQKERSRNAYTTLFSFLGSNNLLDDTPSKKLLTCAVRTVNVRWLMGKCAQSPDEAENIVSTVTSCNTGAQPYSPTSETSSNFSYDAATEEAIPAVLAFNELLLWKEKQLGVDRYGQPIKKVTSSLPTSPIAPTPAPVKEATVWTEEDLSRLQKATAKYPPGTVERWSKIVAVLREKFTEEEAMAKVSELTAALHAAGGAAPSSAGKPPTTGAPVARVNDSSEWSDAQQKQLEHGLRELKDYKEKDKFKKIAHQVEGKTALDCFERYKFLCSLHKQCKGKR